MPSAIVVGSGPNGLTAAAVLARAGVEVTVLEARDTVGGGTRSAALTLPGLVHDVCSAVHPLGALSPALRSLDLARYGLTWAHPPIALAHPLDGGAAAVVHRDLDVTAAGFGADGDAWRQLFSSLSARFDVLAPDVLGPLRRPPAHPLLAARFGVAAALPAALLARRWRGEQARAAFAGVAAHITRPLTRPGSSAAAVLLTSALHAGGWPVARGGSQAIADALVAYIRAHGGRIETGRRITSIDEVPTDVVLLDTAPRGALELLGPRLHHRVRRSYRRYRYGPAAYKVDLAVDGGIPWTNEACRQAGTLHLGGTFDQIAAAEKEVAAGRAAARPFVLVAQQYLADPTRSAGDVHPVWAYAHVPHGYRGDATAAVLGQFERFAPGTRERIVGMSVTSVDELATYNANYVGGDIATGSNDLRQLVFRPRPAWNPYATSVPGVYLCSAATPPGGGVHGQCGANAAAAALRDLGR